MEKKDEYRYKPPDKTFSLADYPHSQKHRIFYDVDGVPVARAVIEYINDPFPYYHLRDLRVDPEESGEGFGNKVREAVEAFLKERRKPGILENAARPPHSLSEYHEKDENPFYRWYERHGWEFVPGVQREISECDFMIFNRPKSISLEMAKVAVQKLMHRNPEDFIFGRGE